MYVFVCFVCFYIPNEVQLININNGQNEYGAIYKFIGKNDKLITQNQGLLYSKKNRRKYRGSNSIYETFYVKFNFQGENFMNIQIYGDHMN